MISYKEIKKNKEVMELIKKGSDKLKCLGFTDHEGANNRIVRIWDGCVCDIDMSEGLKMKNDLSAEEQNVLNAMTGSYLSKTPTREQEGLGD